MSCSATGQAGMMPLMLRRTCKAQSGCGGERVKALGVSRCEVVCAGCKQVLGVSGCEKVPADAGRELVLGVSRCRHV